MSHHFDSAADRAGGCVNLCDLYAFPGAPGTTTLILTVNPDAGRSSPTTFRTDARYEFAMASDGGTTEDLALRITFTEPGEGPQQPVRLLRADGPAAREGTAGTMPPHRSSISRLTCQPSSTTSVRPKHRPSETTTTTGRPIRDGMSHPHGGRLLAAEALWNDRRKDPYRAVLSS